MANLKEFAKNLSVLSPLMEKREKGEMTRLVGAMPCTIVDFDFIDDPDGGYVCFHVKEDAGHFYFGGKVLTDQLHKVEDAGYKAEVQRDGLPCAFEELKSRKKDPKTGMYNKYVNVTFYPEG